MSEKKARQKRHLSSVKNTGGMQAAPAAITQEQKYPLLKVMVCEACFTFKRRLNESTGEWEWNGPDPRFTGDEAKMTGWLGINELPPVSEDGQLASMIWTKLCKEQHLIGSFVYAPDSSDPGMVWSAHFHRPTGPKTKVDVGGGTSDTFASAICAAITGLYSMDLETYHRALFPREYMLNG